MAKEKEKTFRFRQFSVSNRLSAMKVGTDGVLVGAWAPTEGVSTVLDVGTGTGLIALMLAQRTAGATIEAIEVDPIATEEARRNVANSPWADRIAIRNADITEVASDYSGYDLIVSNPPFFTTGELSADTARARARHESALSVGFLINFAATALAPEGRLVMITPADRRGEIEMAATLAHLPPERVVDVVTAPGKAPRRTLWQLARNPSTYAEGVLMLRDEEGNDSSAFKSLTAEFYL